MRTIRKKLMGISEQEPNLLLGSIKFNLFFDDNTEYDKKKLADFSRLLGLEEYLSKLSDCIYSQIKYSLQGTTQSRYLTGGVPPVRFSM